MSLVYTELHRMAHLLMTLRNPGRNLQPTALINEAYLRMASDGEGWAEPDAHFRLSGHARRHGSRLCYNGFILLNRFRGRKYTGAPIRHDSPEILDQHHVVYGRVYPGEEYRSSVRSSREGNIHDP